MNEIVQTAGFSFESLLRGILGIFTLLLIAFAFSRNRKGIDWKLVAKGLRDTNFICCTNIKSSIYTKWL